MERGYFEDFRPGLVFELGSVEVGEPQILAFAREFDPQVFHVDPVGAKTSAFGGLIASGWHTCAMFMRLFVDAVLLETACLGSPGIVAIEFRHPVRPGDTLTGRATVLDATLSRRPGRGEVRMHCELVNADEMIVLSMIARTIISVRPY